MKTLTNRFDEAFLINEAKGFTVYLFTDNKKTVDAAVGALKEIDLKYTIDGNEVIVDDPNGYTPNDVQYYLKKGGVLSKLKP